MTIHKPVLLKESVEKLDLRKGDTVVDATLGGGGHSLAILEKILPDGKLIAIDRDARAIRDFRGKLEILDIKLKKENLELINDNFVNLEEILASLKIFSVNSIIADLGMSSDQVENAERGFSFQKDALLDMRADQKTGLTAKDIVNNYNQRELEKVFKEYGEEKYAARIARAIVFRRVSKPIERTLELVSIIEKSVPAFYKRQKIHFATKTFQALRIEVNQELENLKKFLPEAIGALKRKGRLVIITFHSGEDRIVKSIFRENARGCICPSEFPICQCGIKPKIRLVNKKPITPSWEETGENPRSRSAKLRAVEKI